MFPLLVRIMFYFMNEFLILSRKLALSCKLDIYGKQKDGDHSVV